MKRALIVLALVVSACSSCSNPFGVRSPPLPVGAVRVDSLPTAHYRALWGKIEQCSGKRRSIAEITFYVVPGAILFELHDGRVVAGSYTPHYAIVLAELVTDLDAIVMHEMLHAIRRDTGLGHDVRDFVERCGHLVAADRGDDDD